MHERLRELERRHHAAIQELSSERGPVSENSTELAESQREADALEERCKHLRNILRSSKKIPLAKANDHLLVGTVATIQKMDEYDNPIEPPMTFEITGFDGTDPKSNPPKLSYTAPILDGLFKRRVNPDREPSPVPGQDFYVKLLAIELPRGRPKLSLVYSKVQAA